MPASLLIVQMGRPPEDIHHRFGDQSEWFRQALEGLGITTDTVHPEAGDVLPGAHDVAGAIITGSWSMVTDRADWSERTAAWVREMVAANRALLGVCYGHQLMAHALGGTVDYHPRGREMGCHQVALAAAAKNDVFFADMPEQFGAYLTHEQSVLVPPPGATVLARSEHDAHQILRYGPRALSVQFHPEFTAPLMAACIQRRSALLASEGRDVAAMLSGIGPALQSRRLLHAFVALAAACDINYS